MRRRGKGPLFAVLLIILAASVVLAVSIGSVKMPLWDVVRILISQLPGMGGAASGIGAPYRRIILDVRLPVVMMALFVGAGLSSSGASMQGLFKNPLVDPFIIGISAGGALGYVVGILATEGAPYYLVNPVRIVLSFLFSVGAVFLAYTVARKGSKVPLTHLLLAGVALSASLTAATQLLVYLRIEDPTPVIFSLMGSASNSRWWEVGVVAPVVTLGTILLMAFGRDLNAFSAGEETARNLGVNVEWSKVAVLLLASLVSAIGVPFVGMIGFVGLMVPHMVRRFTGPDQRVLLPASALFGGSFLVLCDLFSRSVIDVTIPLGIVTGLLGGAFFIYLLKGRRWGK
ncbi:MAG: FecCD family ABC transporter permease [Thermoplasmatota archaeon]